MAVKGATRRTLEIVAALAVLLCATPLAAQGSASKLPLTTQDPASAQPSLPKPMPDLEVPGGSDTNSQQVGKKTHASLKTAHHAGRRRVERTRDVAEPIDRPALANVELVEPLPHPPQPPHVTVPVPAYPLENFVTYFTMPPPPLVCAPTRSDQFMPNPHQVDQRPALCTADNP